MGEAKYDNFAFISYNHRDIRFAKWLQKHLESYRLPTEIYNEIDANNRYLNPIFRDESDLNTGVLNDELKIQLEKSKFLIMICSRNSAESKWVSDEAKEFVRLGRLRRIIPVVVQDKPGESEISLFPNYLREYFASDPDSELLGINLKKEGRQRTLIKIISKMLGVSFDSLWKRRLRRLRVKITTVMAATIVAGAAIYLFAIPVRLNIKVETQEATLPQPESITMNVNGALYNSPLKREISFETIKIPGYARFKPLPIKVNAQFYQPKDTLITPGTGAEKKIKISLWRDETFSTYAGNVYTDEMDPLAGAAVKILSYGATTDEEGYFQIRIPLADQREELPIKIEKEGYKTFTREDEPPSTDMKIILHR